MNTFKSLSVFLLGASGLLCFSLSARADSKEGNQFQLQRDIATLQRQVQALTAAGCCYHSEPAPSPTDVYIQYLERVVLTNPEGAAQAIETLDLPAGKYLVFAQVFNTVDVDHIYTPLNGLNGLQCITQNSLVTDRFVSLAQVGSTEALDFLSTLSMVGTTELVAPGQISLSCRFSVLPNTQTTTVWLIQVRLVAHAVGKIHDQSLPEAGPH
jgi:hypothetical protein